MKKHKDIPVPEPKPAESYECPSAPWVEMTGMIPTPTEDEHQRSSYGNIPPYSAE
ncbi:MAG: hypothetical protein IKO47_06520 [Ruminococcus sp.]|nr:hypothetical protein [Ruminococcus sp.]